MKEIASYVKSPSRNKIIFHRDEISGIVPLNLGLQLSEAIYNFKETGKIPMQVALELDQILVSSISIHDQYGSYLSIENPGILFEPELKHNFLKLLESYSQNNLLFVKWDGEIDSGTLYFLSKENGIKINIKNLSHIVI